MGQAVPVQLEPSLFRIEEAASHGIRRVTFLGGEPTIAKSFFSVLDHAQALGFDEITIFTNGARWPERRVFSSEHASQSREIESLSSIPTRLQRTTGDSLKIIYLARYWFYSGLPNALVDDFTIIEGK